MATRRALLVDDELLIRYTLTHALRGEGFEVLAVPSAEDAILALDDRAFDLCFLDVRLPGMSGLDALGVMKRRRPGIRVVLMSAHADARNPSPHPQAAGFLEKPFDLETVRRLASEVLAAR